MIVKEFYRTRNDGVKPRLTLTPRRIFRLNPKWRHYERGSAEIHNVTVEDDIAETEVKVEIIR